MHACLFHIYNHAFTLLVLFVTYPQKIGRDHVRVMLLKQRPIFCHAYIIHSAISYFHVLKPRMIFKLLADSLL
jgi:hypothetical protein